MIDRIWDPRAANPYADFAALMHILDHTRPVTWRPLTERELAAIRSYESIGWALVALGLGLLAYELWRGTR
jgi:hypothetical protein